MTVKLSTGFRNALLNNQSFSEIFSAGVIAVYSGAQPASADGAPTGTLLGYITKDGAAFVPGSPTNGLNWGAAAGGVIGKNSDNWRLAGAAAGTAGWFRLMGNAADNGLASTTLPRIDGAVATSGGELNLSSLTVAVGSITTIDTFNYGIPAQ